MLTNQFEDNEANINYQLTDTANLKMDLDAAIPLGLIVNELVTNAITHASATPTNSLERIADVNIYAGDPIVRRSSALQLTRDAKRGNQAGLNQKLFAELGLKEGDAVRVSQGSHSVDLPATLEVNLASGAVRISAGTMASAKLGSMYGPITVIKA